MNFQIIDSIPTGAKWMAGILVGIFALWFVLGLLFKGKPSDDDLRND